MWKSHGTRRFSFQRAWARYKEAEPGTLRSSPAKAPPTENGAGDEDAENDLRPGTEPSSISLRCCGKSKKDQPISVAEKDVINDLSGSSKQASIVFTKPTASAFFNARRLLKGNFA